MTPEEMLSRLLYRDGMMLVIDNQPGCRCIAAPRRRQPGRLFDALRFGLPRDPALAHRLDKDTSGCLVLGRHRKALALLGKLFKSAHRQTYWAVVEGGPPKTKAASTLRWASSTRTRLVDEARSGRQNVIDDWKVMGRGDGSAGWRWNAHWANASVARPLRRDGLSDSGRIRLRSAPRQGGTPLHLHSRRSCAISKNKPRS